MKASARFLFLGLILSACTASAIITGDNSTAESAPTGDWNVDWANVYKYQSCSSVAVDAYWILTARHVADDGRSGTITSGEGTHTQQEIVYHPSADLALVRYDRAFAGYYSLYTGSFSAGDDMVMIGYGNTGTVSSASFSDSGSGNGTKRWGSNEHSYNQTVAYSIDTNPNTTNDNRTTTNDGFWMGFNNSSTTNEAGVGIYDSGGGSFINDGGTWKLAGINTIRGGSSGSYTQTFAVSVPEYADWVSETVPEPSTILLLLSASGVVGVIRYFNRFYSS